jgi:hypothetical protein
MSNFSLLTEIDKSKLKKKKVMNFVNFDKVFDQSMMII